MHNVAIIAKEDAHRVCIGLLDWATQMWGVAGSPLPSEVFSKEEVEGAKYYEAQRAMEAALAVQEEEDDGMDGPNIEVPCSYTLPSFVWRGSWTSGRVIQFQPLVTGEAVLVASTGTGEPSRFLGRCPAVAEFLPELTRKYDDA